MPNLKINKIQDGSKQALIKEFKMFLCITGGAFLFAFNLISFIRTGGLFPSGFSGLAVLIQRSLAKYFSINIPFTILYVPINLPAVYIAFKYIGKKFTFYSLYAIILMSVISDILPTITITSDMLLISVFGGIINGVACTLCLLSGASAGGTQFLSVYFSEKKGIDTWNYVLLGNVVLLVIAGFLFGWEKALYSIIFQFVSTQILNTLYKRYQKHTLLIITDNVEETYHRINELTNHDATIFKGTGCYEGAERQMLYSVVSSDEVSQVIKVIHEVDPSAFINSLRTEQIEGRFYRPER